MGVMICFGQGGQRSQSASGLSCVMSNFFFYVKDNAYFTEVYAIRLTVNMFVEKKSVIYI